MIDAKELRTGNWVRKSGDGTPYMVTLEKFWQHYESADAFYYLEPIPLSPEILEKCGFNNPAKVLDIADGFFLTTDEAWGFRIQLEKDSDDLGYMCEHLKLNHIKYLHQLQTFTTP